MQRLRELIAANEQWLTQRLLGYAKDHGYAHYGPTRVEDWTSAVAGTSQALFEAMEQYGEDCPEFSPDADYTTHPVASMALEQARRHRSRGVSLPMYLGLLKYFRQTYIDLIHDHAESEESARRCRRFVARCFDLFEIALSTEWIRPELSAHVEDLQKTNRDLTNEKNKFLTLFESISDPVFLVDQAGVIEHLNISAATFLGVGLSPEELAPFAGEGLMPSCPCTETGSRRSLTGRRLSESLPWIAKELRAFLSGNRQVLRRDMQAQCRGEKRWFRVTLSRMLDISGKFSGAVVVLGDVTQQTRAEKEMARSRDLLQTLMDGTPALIAYIGRDLRYRFVNRYYETIYGLSTDEIVGKHVSEIIGEKTYQDVKDKYDRTLAGEDQHFELVYKTKNMGTRYFDVSYLPHRYGDQIDGIILLILDMTDRVQAENEREKFFKLSPDMMCVAGFDGFFKHLNPAWTRVLGWSEEELLARPFASFVLPEDLNATMEEAAGLRLGKTSTGFENRYRCKDGSFRWITWNSISSPDEGLVYAVAHDTTKRREMEETLRRLAAKDSLTGANNRRHFFELGERAFAGAKRYGRPLSAIMLDIDHFKRINDTYGHAVGDLVLQDLVRTCSQALRDADILGRMGGEEFAAVLPETNANRAFATAERLRKKLASTTVHADGHELKFTVSIGVATSGENDDLEALIKCADDALYEAKRSGRNKVIASCGADGPSPSEA